MRSAQIDVVCPNRRRSWGWDKEVLISVFEGVSSEAIKVLC
jgi:hypothetical protein